MEVKVWSPPEVQWAKGSGVASAVASVIAGAEIQFLAWELPYAVDEAIKRKRRRERGGREEGKEEILCEPLGRANENNCKDFVETGSSLAQNVSVAYGPILDSALSVQESSPVIHTEVKTFRLPPES